MGETEAVEETSTFKRCAERPAYTSSLDVVTSGLDAAKMDKEKLGEESVARTSLSPSP
jgi:hypothetical protein